MARMKAKGTVNATTSGVEIPVVANLETGIDNYVVRLRVTDAGGDVAFVPGGITPVFLEAASVAPSSGTAIDVGPSRYRSTSANPKVICASGTVAVAWELWAESDGYERDA